MMTGSLPAAADISADPAVRAWDMLRRSHPEHRTPTAVTTLKAKPKRAGVYRLAGASASGASIIAKRCRWPIARLEQTLYQQLLTRVALPHLAFYGVVADPTPEFAWVFLEDAGDERYRASDPASRRLAARWLAAMHLASQDLIGVVDLPDRSPESYRAQARLTRQAIQDSRTNPAIAAAHRDVLTAIDHQLDLIERQWTHLDAACRVVPFALVHGDLACKNVHLRGPADGLEFIVLDWETAGWGVPAVDLCQLEGKPVRPDLDTYWSFRTTAGTDDVTRSQVDELARVGGIFRMITSMYWAALWLSFTPVDRAMTCLTSYSECLTALTDQCLPTMSAS
jgi:hypothetical protein